MMRKTSAYFCMSTSTITQELTLLIRGKWDVDGPKVAKLKQDFGNELLGVATVNTAYGGMQDLTSLVYEPWTTSVTGRTFSAAFVSAGCP